MLFLAAERLQEEARRVAKKWLQSRWRPSGSCLWPVAAGTPGKPLLRAQREGFVHSLTFPVACPATDFPAGAVGRRNEGEKIGECGFIPAPEKH